MVDEYLAEDAANAGIKDMPFWFGAELHADIDAQRHGVRDQLADRSWVWRVALSAPGAVSMNLLFDRYAALPGAILWLSNPNTGERFGVFTDANMQASGELATSLVSGDSLVLEYYEPANATFAGDLHRSQVVHRDRELGAKSAKNF